MDFSLLVAAIDELINISISRFSIDNSNLCYSYIIDLKTVFSRERLTYGLSQDAKSFCEARKIATSIEKHTGALLVEIDLKLCILNITQAQNLRAALAQKISSNEVISLKKVR